MLESSVDSLSHLRDWIESDDEPAETFPGLLWLDTSDDPHALKRRNAADDGWVTVGAEGDGNGGEGTSGQATIEDADTSIQVFHGADLPGGVEDRDVTLAPIDDADGWLDGAASTKLAHRDADDTSFVAAVDVAPGSGNHVTFAWRVSRLGDPPPFSPDDLGDLYAWYAADEIDGLSDTDPVAQWDDLSGADRHLTQGTASRRPTYREGQLNGLPVVRFDGVDNAMVASFGGMSQPYTGVAVVQPASGKIQIVWNQDSSSSWAIGAQVEDDDAWVVFAGSVVDSAGNTVSSPAVVATILDGGSSVIRDNGDEVAFGDADSRSMADLKIGQRGAGNSDRNLDGDLAELILYNRRLTSQELVQLEGHLSEKWGL